MNSRKIRVALYLSEMTVPEKISKGLAVAQALGSNAAVFATPGTVVTGLSSATTALQTAWINAEDGATAHIAAKYDMEQAFDLALIQVANYVENVANGDESIIHLATFDVRPAPHPQKNSYSVKPGKESGQVLLITEVQNKALYQWQYSTDPSNANGWISMQPGSKSRSTISGLTPGTRYWFRCAYLDKEGSHPYSEPLSLIVT